MATAAKERMIEAAERLFAQRGFGGVSLREIRAATGQRNTAAVHYHFGTKQRLVEAILEYRMQRRNEQRLAMLAEVERGGRLADLRALVEAEFCPFSDSLRRGSYYARFLAQAQSDPAASRFLIDYALRTQQGARLANTRFHAALRKLPASVRTHRLRSAGLMWIQRMAEHERELESRRGPAMPTAALAADLVNMIVAMLSAPVSPVTRRLLRRRAVGRADALNLATRRTRASPAATRRRA